MHLLVLSAFRPFPVRDWTSCSFQVSMHLLVLSAFRPEMKTDVSVGKFRSQCTFWCSVLSDFTASSLPARMLRGLNAPSGAQCFPTETSKHYGFPLRVSMHLLVLSAFRLKMDYIKNDTQFASQCTFWCSVLSDSMPRCVTPACFRSQCTFWCSVLSDLQQGRISNVGFLVSMHLLVLSAFRPEITTTYSNGVTMYSLNAPSGAQCFPTLLENPV